MTTLYLHHFDGHPQQSGTIPRNCAANLVQLHQDLTNYLANHNSAQFSGFQITAVDWLNNVTPPATVAAGSVILIHGHGGLGNSDISYDSQDSVTAANATAFINARVANLGQNLRIYFVVCYSAKREQLQIGQLDHVARVCSATLTNAVVFGTKKKHGGGVHRRTRSGYSGSNVTLQMVQV